MNITTAISKRIIWGSMLAIAGMLPVYAQNAKTTDMSVPENKTIAKKVSPYDTSVVKDAAETSAARRTAHNWTGGYIGGHIGAGWGNGNTLFDPRPNAATFVNLRPTNVRVRPKGILGGVQGGYNWQSGNVVFGVESDLALTDVKRNSLISPITQNNGTPFPGNGSLTAGQKIKWMGSLRPRVGAAFGNVLVYGTAGLAYGSVQYTANTDFRPFGTTQYPVSFTKTRTGWTAGGGTEIALSDKWSIKGEYRYYDLGNQSLTANPLPALPPFQVAYTWKTQGHSFVGGVNFHF